MFYSHFKGENVNVLLPSVYLFCWHTALLQIISHGLLPNSRYGNEHVNSTSARSWISFQRGSAGVGTMLPQFAGWNLACGWGHILAACHVQVLLLLPVTLAKLCSHQLLGTNVLLRSWRCPGGSAECESVWAQCCGVNLPSRMYCHVKAASQ